MSDGFYRPKYRDRKTGRVRTAKVYWSRDPVSGLRVSTGMRTIEGATAWRAERERRAASPHYAASHEATVGQWIDRVNKLKELRKSEGTAAMYKSKFGHVARIFGTAAPMASINPESVDAYVEKRQEEGAVNNTIGKELTAIVQLCKHAKRRGEFSGDLSALRPIGFSIDYSPRTAHLEPGHFRKLAKVLEPHELAAVKVIVATNARRAEYYRMQRIDIDLKRGLVAIRGTKTPGARRVVPVPSLFLPLLKSAVRHLEPKWTRITHELPERCKVAKVPRVTPNDLRRTHSTWLVEAGVSKDRVAESMGHVDSRMVEQVYGRGDPSATLRVMEAQIGVVRAAEKASKSRRKARAKGRRAA